MAGEGTEGGDEGWGWVVRVKDQHKTLKGSTEILALLKIQPLPVLFKSG